MIQTMIRSFSFKGTIKPKPFFKKMGLFILLYFVLVFFRVFVFYITARISSNMPNAGGVEYKMKPLSDGFLAWLITFIITHLLYSIAVLALMVRRMNDTKIWSGLIVVIYFSWFVGNLLLLYYYTSFNTLDHIISPFIGFNGLMITISWVLLAQPSEEESY